MKRAVLLLFVIAAPAWAADPPATPEAPPAMTAGPPLAAAGPRVTLPATRTVLPRERFSLAPVVSNGGVPRWYLPDPAGLKEDRTFLDLIPDTVTIDGTAVDFASKIKGRVFYSDTPGVFRVVVYCAGDGRVASDIAVCVVTVGDAPPVPPPGPGPTPPGPTPPTPGPVANLRVLVTYDAATVTKLPASQQSVLYSKAVRDALDAATPAGPDGKTHQWRMWAEGTDATGEGSGWAELMKRTHAAGPWVIFAGDSGVAYEGPLPAAVPEMLALIQKYAPKSLRKAG
jgi:hypothetical protein